MTDNHATLDFTRPVLAEVQNSVLALQPVLKSAVETDSPVVWREVEQRLLVIANTLTLVNLRGARLLVEEMLAVAAVESPARDETKPATTGTEAHRQLLAAGAAFVDYTDYLLAGNADRVPALVPLVNNLRACRHEPLLSENVVVADAFDIQTNLTVDATAVESVEQLNQLLRLSLIHI